MVGRRRTLPLAEDSPIVLQFFLTWQLPGPLRLLPFLFPEVDQPVDESDHQKDDDENHLAEIHCGKHGMEVGLHLGLVDSDSLRGCYA